MFGILYRGDEHQLFRPNEYWAEWAAEGGIPFGLLLLSIAIWSIPKALRTVWGIGLLAVFAHSMVDYPLHVPVLELWLFTLLGALAVETGNRNVPALAPRRNRKSQNRTLAAPSGVS